jgi:hypothetical protein
VDEQAWLTSTDPQAMLAFLRDSGQLTDRKARLLAVACCRRLWHLLADERSRAAVDVAERYADGLASLEAMRMAFRAAGSAIQESYAARAAFYCTVTADDEGYDFADVPAYIARGVLAAAVEAVTSLADSYDGAVMARAAERAAQAVLLRCIFGDRLNSPHLPPGLPDTLAPLARAAYDERELPSGHLDQDHLAVLADALEEAGADAELAAHLRSPDPHVRGCHVIDTVLGKA